MLSVLLNKKFTSFLVILMFVVTETLSYFCVSLCTHFREISLFVVNIRPIRLIKYTNSGIININYFMNFIVKQTTAAHSRMSLLVFQTARSSQCSTTSVTKAVVCVVLFV